MEKLEVGKYIVVSRMSNLDGFDLAEAAVVDEEELVAIREQIANPLVTETLTPFTTWVSSGSQVLILKIEQLSDVDDISEEDRNRLTIEERLERLDRLGNHRELTEGQLSYQKSLQEALDAGDPAPSYLRIEDL